MPSQAYRRLEEIFETALLLKRTLSFLNWDSAVMMPEAAARLRGRQTAAQTGVIHRTLTDPAVQEFLDKADTADLDPWQRANLREMRRVHKLHTALPEELQARLSKQAVLTELAWRGARKDNDYAAFSMAFAPLLDLLREKAEHLGTAFGVSPYEGLMLEYDPDAARTDLEALFSKLAVKLPPLIRDVVDRQKGTGARPPDQPHMPPGQQKKLCRRVLKDLGFDFERGRLDESAHPFTEGSGPDVRMTTSYDPKRPLHGLLASIHECGHALYDQHLPEAWDLQPVGQERGMAVHESVALFYEMALTRTGGFADYLSRCLKDLDISWEAGAIHAALMHVRPGTIRIEADEVSYIPHIILRYEHERQLLDGTLNIADIPDSWTARMEELLGIKPATHAEGALQDIHWSLGLFGYFPCYAKGLILASALFERCRGEISKLDFSSILSRLDSDIFSKASLEPVLPLTGEVFGSPDAAERVLAHFSRRYTGREAEAVVARA